MPKRNRRGVRLNNNYIRGPLDLQREVELEIPENDEQNFFDSLVLQADRNRNRVSLTTHKDCVICNRHPVKKNNARSICLKMPCNKALLKQYAERLDDQVLINRLDAIKYPRYHRECWTAYREEFRKKVVSLNDEENVEDIHISRGLHKVTYAAICNFIHEEIIEKEQCILLHEINLQYKAIIHALNETDPVCLDKYSDYDLTTDLTQDFDEITVDSTNDIVCKKGVVWAFHKTVPTNVSWTYLQIKQVLSEIAVSKIETN